DEMIAELHAAAPPRSPAEGYLQKQIPGASALSGDTGRKKAPKSAVSRGLEVQGPRPTRARPANVLQNRPVRRAGSVEPGGLPPGRWFFLDGSNGSGASVISVRHE